MGAIRAQRGIQVGVVRPQDAAQVVEVVGDGAVAHLDREVALRCWCPDEVEHLLEPPGDLDDLVAVLRWMLAHRLDIDDIDDVAAGAAVEAGRIMGFLLAPARAAGGLLTIGEAARLARYLEARLEDRELADQAGDHWALAAPYLEAADLDYAEALRRAHAVRDEHRAARPDAAVLLGAG